MRLTDVDKVLKKKKINPQGITASITESLYDVAKELSYYDPVRSNRDLRTGPVPMSQIPTPAGKVARVVKKNFIAPFMDAYQTMGKVNTGKSYTAEEALNFAGTGLVASMLGGPKTGNPSELAVIKQPPVVTKAIRSVLKREYKARGKRTGTALDTLLRRTFFRGEKHGRWPEVPRLERAPNFGHKLRTSSNIGEPLGVSASLSPEVAIAFTESHGDISRAIPLFGDVPENVVLNSMNPAHQEILKEAYTEAFDRELNDMPLSELQELVDNPTPWRALRQDTFNESISGELQLRGFKGILYDPNRYSELELKMFNTEDLLHLDLRSAHDRGITRYGQTRGTKSADALADYVGTMGEFSTDKGSSLGAQAYQDIDMKKLIDRKIASVLEERKVKALQELQDILKVGKVVDDSVKPTVETVGKILTAGLVDGTTEGLGDAITSVAKVIQTSDHPKVAEWMLNEFVGDWSADERAGLSSLVDSKDSLDSIAAYVTAIKEPSKDAVVDFFSQAATAKAQCAVLNSVKSAIQSYKITNSITIDGLTVSSSNLKSTVPALKHYFTSGEFKDSDIDILRHEYRADPTSISKDFAAAYGDKVASIKKNATLNQALDTGELIVDISGHGRYAVNPIYSKYLMDKGITESWNWPRLQEIAYAVEELADANWEVQGTGLSKLFRFLGYIPKPFKSTAVDVIKELPIDILEWKLKLDIIPDTADMTKTVLTKLVLDKQLSADELQFLRTIAKSGRLGKIKF